MPKSSFVRTLIGKRNKKISLAMHLRMQFVKCFLSCNKSLTFSQKYWVSAGKHPFEVFLS